MLCQYLCLLAYVTFFYYSFYHPSYKREVVASCYCFLSFLNSKMSYCFFFIQFFNKWLSDFFKKVDYSFKSNQSSFVRLKELIFISQGVLCFSILFIHVLYLLFSSQVLDNLISYCDFLTILKAVISFFKKCLFSFCLTYKIGSSA